MSDVLTSGTDLTPRKCLAYISSLPYGCATNAALQGGPQYRGWTPDTYMQANVVDAVQNGNFAFIKANSKKHARVDQPKPVERPQDATKRKKSNPATNKFAAMARMAYKAGKKNRKDA